MLDYSIISALSSFAIILMRKIDGRFFFFCLLDVLQQLDVVGAVLCQQYDIVLCPDHKHLLLDTCDRAIYKREMWKTMDRLKTKIESQKL